MTRKKSFMTVMAAMIIMVCTVSMAITATAGSNDLEQELIQLPAFKFWNHDKNGIGYGNCPVYTAPYKNAYRCADGKASCQTNAQMSEAGLYSGWLLVRYETNNGGYRVGYIPPEYVRGFKSKMGNRKFEHFIPATANDTIYVTDNPMMLGSRFAKLKAGAEFYVLAKYTYYGDWWYIECTVDGQVARGFIDRESSDFDVGIRSDSSKKKSASSKDSGKKNSKNKSKKGSGSGKGTIPDLSPLGTSYRGDVKIDGDSNGNRIIVRENANPKSKQVTVVYPGKKYPCYAEKRGTTGKTWYYLWIDADSAWGWVSSGHATFLGK